jgi:hypothetical protein
MQGDGVEESDGLAQEAQASGLWRTLARNLRAGIGFLGFRAKAAGRISNSVPPLLVLLLLALLLGFANDFAETGWHGQFNPKGLVGELFGAPWLLLTAWLIARLAGAESRTLAATTPVLVIWLLLSILLVGLGHLPARIWAVFGAAGYYAYWGFYAWGILASTSALIRTTGLAGRWRSFAGGLAVSAFLVAPNLLIELDQRLWIPVIQRDEQSAARWYAPAAESVLYGEAALLDRTLAGLQPSRPGAPELFLVALGGTGSQDVFMREVRQVQALFDQRFGTFGRSVVLLNNPATLKDYPIASVTALRRTLQTVGQRMDRDKDVLVLFMTSHGASNAHFQLELWPYRFDELNPSVLREALNAAGIRYRVLIISACYSGSFIEPLQGPDTLIMTASRADRTSHGCSHEADWTFFGRALFAEELKRTHSFEQAFAAARTTIAERETAEDYEHSEPQISVGERIRAKLAEIERRLDR